MKNIIVVTGASSGMGKEFLLQILEEEKDIDEIWAIARRAERLIELKNNADVRIVPFVLDLSSETDLKRYKEKLAEEAPNIAVSDHNGRLYFFVSIQTSTADGLLPRLFYNHAFRISLRKTAPYDRLCWLHNTENRVKASKDRHPRQLWRRRAQGSVSLPCQINLLSIPTDHGTLPGRSPAHSVCASSPDTRSNG